MAGFSFMPVQFDVIIVGLGAMGSAAAHHLAKSGRRVLGIDRFRPPHDSGSSHGRTRIIREAYYENPLYVPLLRRAYELWEELEKRSGRQLMLKTGGLMIGLPDGELVKGTRQSAEEHHLPHEILTAEDLRKRFPIFQPQPDIIACWEPRAGILFPEFAIKTHLELAAQDGASLLFDEPVLKWEKDGDGVAVFTKSGTYRAGQLLLAAGAWLKSLLGNLDLPLVVERQIQFWFDPVSEPELFRPEHCPVYIWEYGPQKHFYGLPDLGEGLKAAMHHQSRPEAPDHLDRAVTNEEVEAMRNVLRRFVPRANGRLKSNAVCMYTNTPDCHFVFGRHAECPQVVMASPCSGHGFKFCTVIGELAAKTLTGQKSGFDLSLFNPDRFPV